MFFDVARKAPPSTSRVKMTFDVEVRPPTIILVKHLVGWHQTTVKFKSDDGWVDPEQKP